MITLGKREFFGLKKRNCAGGFLDAEMEPFCGDLSLVSVFSGRS